MTIEPSTLMQILTFAVSVGGSIYAWVMSQGKAAQHEIAALRAEHAATAAKVLKLENDLEHVPDKEVIHRIELSMQKLQGEVEQATQQWTAVQRSIQRLEEFLMQVQATQASAATPSRRRSSK